MKLISGKELFDAFTGIDASMKKLERITSGKLHVSAQFRGIEFDESGEVKEIAAKFKKWVGSLPIESE